MPIVNNQWKNEVKEGNIKLWELKHMYVTIKWILNDNKRDNNECNFGDFDV